MKEEIQKLYTGLKECGETSIINNVSHFILVMCHDMKSVRVGAPKDQPFIDTDGVERWRGHTALEKFIVLNETYQISYSRTVRDLMDVCEKLLNESETTTNSSR